MMYQKKPKKAKSPLAKAASKTPKNNPSGQSTAPTRGVNSNAPAYQASFMSSFQESLEKSIGTEAARAATSIKPENRIY